MNNRYNNIQIDGANSNDMFGLGGTGQPGGQSNGKSISLDAVKEYQVLLSPYDLNFSGFNGALVNAVTKSGTNEFDGDIFYYFRNQNYAANVPFIQNSGLYVEQYGASVSGPIIKDRLQFFANGEWQLRAQPSTGPYIGQAPGAASPLTVDSATTQRFINDLTALGIPAGTGGATNNQNPLTNAFGRLDLALPEINSTLTFRDNYASGSLDVFSRTSTFPLTSQLYTINNTNNSVVLQLNSTMQSGSSNEFIAAYQTISDLRLPIAGQYPDDQRDGARTPERHDQRTRRRRAVLAGQLAGAEDAAAEGQLLVLRGRQQSRDGRRLGRLLEVHESVHREFVWRVDVQLARFARGGERQPVPRLDCRLRIRPPWSLSRKASRTARMSRTRGRRIRTSTWCSVSASTCR